MFYIWYKKNNQQISEEVDDMILLKILLIMEGVAFL